MDGIIQNVLKNLAILKIVEFLKSQILIFRLTCDKHRARHRWHYSKSIEIPNDFEDV